MGFCMYISTEINILFIHPFTVVQYFPFVSPLIFITSKNYSCYSSYISASLCKCGSCPSFCVMGLKMCLLLIVYLQYWENQTLLYQLFCLACWNFCLRHCNFPLTTHHTPSTHPNCCRLSCLLSSWIPACHTPPALPPLTACGGSFWNPKPGVQDCKWEHITIASGHDVPNFSIPAGQCPALC